MATIELAEPTVAPAPKPAVALTHQLLHGPIVPTLLRLAAPNVVVIAVQAVVNAAEAMFVGWLGAEALAGVALVFPLIMLMQTMSAGGMGGGVAAAVARAVGAGRRADADALAWHACVIALVMGALFTTGFAPGRAGALRARWAAPAAPSRSPLPTPASCSPARSGSGCSTCSPRRARHRQHALAGAGRPGRRRDHADRLARADSRLGALPADWACPARPWRW